MEIFVLTICIIVFFILYVEIRHKLRPSSPLKVWTENWEIENNNNEINLSGEIKIYNPHPKMEIMIPEISIRTKLLAKGKVDRIVINNSITPNHSDESNREDEYWQAYIVKSNKSTSATATISLREEAKQRALEGIESIWIEIHWISYGPFGRMHGRHGSVIPIARPKPIEIENAYFKKYEHCQLLPIKTHILGSHDNLSKVIKEYVSNILTPGDILTIGETPLAVMQGRYIHPSSISPSWISRLLCRGFHPTSSLATACGLQTLIDLVGPSRVILSWCFGFLGKTLGVKGLFYIFAGEQARLIDDITGTTPPYDQTIVLGPQKSKEICENVANEFGIEIAIVDVNDLGRVKILACSSNCPRSIIKNALITNPAGNANEQTPLVLIRPK